MSLSSTQIRSEASLPVTMYFKMMIVRIPGLKRLEDEEGGVAYRYRLCDTPNETKVPS